MSATQTPYTRPSRSASVLQGPFSRAKGEGCGDSATYTIEIHLVPKVGA